MRKMIRTAIICLMTAFLLFGCSGNGQGKNAEISSAAPTADHDTTAGVGEDFVQTIAPATPIPEEIIESEPSEEPTPFCTDTPAPTDTSAPTDTPAPNPYVGVWTIEDLPFSLELRDDKTYLITVSEDEKEGAYTFDEGGVYLSVPGNRSVELRYYSRADTLKAFDFKLVRDDLVFFFDIGGVPVSFRTENEDLRVQVRGAIVEVQVKDGKTIRSYCFTGKGLVPPDDSADWFDAGASGTPTESFRAYKYDGSYSLWTRDADDALLASIDVVVRSGYEYPIESEGIDYLHKSLGRFLKERGTNTDELNRTISRNVIAAGIYTRAGAVTAGVSLISALSKYGYSIGYQENGNYQAEQEWGVNPRWGDKLSLSEREDDPDETEPVSSYTGMNSAAGIVWAYKQAGLNLCADSGMTIVSLGERENALDNRIEENRAQSGDIIVLNGRYRMVIDRLDRDGNGSDDAYLTFEMGSPIMTLEILPFKQMHGEEVYAMDAFFDGTGRNIDSVRYWKDTFRIPADQLPTYIRETMEAEQKEQNYLELLEALGF